MNPTLFPGVYFVSGIDTDAGKSYATGLLARRLMADGQRVLTQKLVQTGGGEISEDIVLHRRLMGVPLQPEDRDGTTCGQLFGHPCSPHLAAQLEGREVDLERIDRSTELLRTRCDTLLIEGAGGLMVPLRPDCLTIDYLRDRNLPLLLVTSARLGSLNHTLLSLEACRTRGIRLAGILFNHFPATDPLIAEDTRNYLKNHVNGLFPQARWIEIELFPTDDIP